MSDNQTGPLPHSAIELRLQRAEKTLEEFSDIEKNNSILLKEIHEFIVGDRLKRKTGLVDDVQRNREILQSHESLILEVGRDVEALETRIAPLDNIPGRVKALEDASTASTKNQLTRMDSIKWAILMYGIMKAVELTWGALANGESTNAKISYFLDTLPL